MTDLTRNFVWASCVWMNILPHVKYSKLSVRPNSHVKFCVFQIHTVLQGSSNFSAWHRSRSNWFSIDPLCSRFQSVLLIFLCSHVLNLYIFPLNYNSTITTTPVLSWIRYKMCSQQVHDAAYKRARNLMQHPQFPSIILATVDRAQALQLQSPSVSFSACVFILPKLPSPDSDNCKCCKRLIEVLATL
jgi:hypothetical protein